MRLTDAVNSGAIAAFSEKYGETVRVIDVLGVSKELCGGTHVDNIRKLYPFKILNETSVAAGLIIQFNYHMLILTALCGRNKKN
jgi:alanyl-tRNA synthetase